MPGASITLSSPNQQTLAIPYAQDTYSKAVDPLPAVPTLSTLAPSFFSGGTWTINAPGGRNVAAFRQTFTLPPPLRWTNRDSLTTIDRNSDLVIAWDSQGYASTETVTVTLFGSQQPGTNPSALFCSVQAQAGKLTVARDLLQKLPPSDAASLGVSISSDSARPGLFHVPLTSGGDAPVSVSRYSSETMTVVVK